MAEFWEIRVRGLVQGVGFRPCVWRVARAAGLRGEVLNDARGVIVRLACSRAQREAFEAELRVEKPQLARIDEIRSRPLIGPAHWRDFSIVASEQGTVSTGIVPDAATCPDCLAEIMDPADRRHGYAFANCTNCGPRLSITRAIPYDRANTAMAAFPMCPDCLREYDDPADRRFHAQPNACPECGPRLSLVDRLGQAVPGDAVTAAASAIRAGKVLAIKGLGGFQLACDARSQDAVSTLRARKNRPDKPLALMVRDLAMADGLVMMDDAAEKALSDPAAPIVLLPVVGQGVAQQVAPGQGRLGIMLPSTPLHHILMGQLEGPIVLTSGNLSGEPQVSDNAQALERLAPIADLWLLHDRDIVNRLDDSVLQLVDRAPTMLRRARGFAPAPLLLHPGFAEAPPVLAMGADMKNAFALVRDSQAIVSQHIGDMENPLVQRDARASLALYRDIYRFEPSQVVVDLHPGYFSTRLGQSIAERDGLAVASVQHHHAHVAAAMAEAGLAPDCSPVLGVVLDGLGQGDDGTIWGGEFLLADFRDYERLAQFLPVALPGGDKANRQPWRNAVAHFLAAYGDARPGGLGQHGEFLDGKPIDLVTQMVGQGLNSPLASSAGRLFDAVAAVLGLSPDGITFEGQAAMQLQALAETCDREAGHYPVSAVSPLSWRPLWDGLLSDLASGTDRAIVARRFHNTLVSAVGDLAISLAREHGVRTVVPTGGVMQNALLWQGLGRRIRKAGLEVLVPRSMPVNDGGIALGQGAIVAARLIAGHEGEVY